MTRIKQDQWEDEKIQKDLRETLNPGWREQRLEHFRALRITGPQNKPAREIINRALALEGFATKKKRKRNSVFE